MSVKKLTKYPKRKLRAKTIPVHIEDDFEESPQTYFVPPPSTRLIVKRDGHNITKKIPKPVVLIDSREKTPFNFTNFPNWIAGEKIQKLDVGDYSVKGMEDLLVLERKTLTDLITTLIQQGIIYIG